MIKAGDIVRVKDWGNAYTTYAEWFRENASELNIDWIIRYAYDNDSKYINHKCDDADKYQVLYVKDRYALITRSYSFPWSAGAVYLVGIGTLELYDKPTEMTVSEIEKRLGIENLKIVKEKEDE